MGAVEPLERHLLFRHSSHLLHVSNYLYNPNSIFKTKKSVVLSVVIRKKSSKIKKRYFVLKELYCREERTSQNHTTDRGIEHISQK